MDDILKKPLFWVVIIFTVLNVGVFLIGKVVVDQAAIKVIEKLQSDYSPSPYGPGINPDLVDINAIKNQKLYLEMTQPKAVNEPSLGKNVLIKTDGVRKEIVAADRWSNEWESDRGFQIK